MKRFALGILFVMAAMASGQDVPLTLKGDTQVVQVDKVIVVKEDRTVVKSFPLFVIAPADIGFYRWTYPATTKATDKGNTLQVDAAPKGDLKVDLKVESAIVVDGKIKYVTQFSSIVVAIGAPEPVPPIPPIPPDPKPPIPPTPVPVTSFRVIFVTESGNTLTASQRSVIDAKVVRDYLTANTTPEGGFAGWRQYDPQQNVANEQPTMKKLWEAVQPSLTALPCVAIETNGKADILPLAATPAAQIDVFKSYKAGVK